MRRRKGLCLVVLAAVVVQLFTPLGLVMADPVPESDVTDKVVIGYDANNDGSISSDEEDTSITISTSSGTIIPPDSSGNYSSIPVGATIKLKHTFHLLDNNGLDSSDPNYEEYNYNENDYYKIPLPNGILFSLPAAMSLDDGSGNNVGTLVISHDSTLNQDFILVSFSAYAVANSDVRCQFQIDGTFHQDVTSPGTNTSLSFILGGTAFSISISQPPLPPANVTVEISKTGVYDASANTITWTVLATPSEKTGSLSVVDLYSANQVFVSNSFTVNGSQITDSPPTAELEVDTAGRTITYSFPGEAEGLQTITYQTTPAAGAFGSENGANEAVSFGNTATAKINGDTKGTASATVSPDWIQKSGWVDNSSTNDANVRLIHWQVNVNNYQPAQTISGAEIVDTIPEGLGLVAGTVKLGTNTVVHDTDDSIPPDPGTYSYVNNPDGTHTLVYKFNGAITGPQTLYYDTVVTNPDQYLNSNTQKTYVNHALLTWTENSGAFGTPSDDTGVGIGRDVISKTSPGILQYDPSNNTITWTVRINRNKVGITNAVVTDDIPVGLEYVPNSFSIDDSDGSGGYNGDFSYTAAPVGDSSKSGTLTYSFKKASAPSDRTINDSYTLTYKTEITDFSRLFANGTVNFANTVRLTGAGIKDGQQSSTRTQQFDSEVVSKAVASHYDYNTRRIKWQIVVNRNQLYLTNARIEDSIPVGMSFLPDTFKVTDANGTDVTAVGSLSPTLLPESDITGRDAFTYTFSGPIDHETYTVTYETQVKEAYLLTQGNKSFTNEVYFISDYGTASASATETIHNSIVEKKQVYHAGDDYIRWEVPINTGSLTLSDIKLVDDLQAGLELDTASVRLYHMALNGDGTLTKGSEVSGTAYGVDYDPSTRKFTFTVPGEINSVYQLEFITDVVVDSLTVNNSITFQGTGVSASSSVHGLSIVVDNSWGSGSANNGSITITKVDAVTGQPLAGAEFKLEDIQRNQVGASKTTDSLGNAVFDSLRFKTFYIQEVEPPYGYLRNDTPIKFRLTSSEHVFSYTFANTKATGDISFAKQTLEGKPLGGAQFTLYDSMDNPIQTAVSDSSGNVLFTGIPVGDYLIKETLSPAGFYKTDETVNAKVEMNAAKTGVVVTVTPDTIKNTPFSGITFGSILIYKTDEASKPLKGAKFTLYNAAGNAVMTAVSDEQGKVWFTNLAEGNYTLRETEAPVGYVLNSRTINVKIDDSSSKTFDFVNKAVETTVPGAITVIKTDEEGSPLAGAEFSLYDENGALLKKAVTGQDGRTLFENLPLGTYTVEETGAPQGYVLSTQKLTVTVDGDTAKVLNFVNIPEEKVIDNPGDKGAVRILKIDEKSRPLPGAEFTLFDKNGSPAATVISGDDGIAFFSGLVPGAYSVQETKAPEGYAPVSDKLTIDIAAGQTVAYSFRNVPVEEITDNEVPQGWVNPDDPEIPAGTPVPTLPKAGQTVDSLVIALAGAALVLAGTLWLVFKRHRRRSA